MTSPTENPYRLPRTVVPHRYTIALEPDLAAATFTGHLIIDAVAAEGAERVVMNAAELSIERVAVHGHDATFRLDDDTERLIIDAAVDQEPTTIEITFAGVLNDKLRGWYRSTFRDPDGIEHVIATSQMQSTDCRRAFPCFDEPDFKAVFDITLVVEPHLAAISNGAEVERTEHDNGKVAVRFAETMPMSTYLVAIVVGPLEASRTVDVPRVGGGSIPLRILHVPGNGHLTDFGLDVGAFCLQWFQRYYGIPYPTEKCDMLALPDFAAGAMENLGCITFREHLLLVDPQTSTQHEQQLVADVVAHELAHMWFGDLVTMKWWNGIWLNEAFATFMEIAACEAYRPDWLRWTTFSLERSAAFEVDSLASTRSVEYAVEAPADCDGMFDVLTYQKGGSLLRMLEQYLGEEGFRRGVSHYLSTHEYGNTETGDLWDAIEASNPHTPVRALMDSWIWQPGYPLVSARLDGGELLLQQQRFAFGDTDDPTLFVVPVHLRIDGTVSKVLLSGFEVRVPLPSPDSRVVVNAGGHGFMRVAYDHVLRGRLAGDELSTLSIIDRYNLVDDAWNEVVAGRLTAAAFLEFVEGFGRERDYAVWQAIAVGLRGASRLVEGAALAAFRHRVGALVGPVLAELGWEPAADEPDLVSSLRGLLVSLHAVLGGDADSQARCRALLDDEAAPAELAAAATMVVAAIGDDADQQRYIDAYRSATTPQEKERFLFALAEFPTAEQMARTLEFAFSPEVRTQDAPFLLRNCIGNRWQGEQAWRFVRSRWQEANDRFPGSSIVRMIDRVRLLTRPDVAADVQAFFAEHPIPQAAKTLDQVLERQRVNAAMHAREEQRFTEELTS
ncbi:MAG: M1 family metallopeptidase [Actinomycetota bacterium]